MPATKTIPVPPLGKIEYLTDHEKQVLPPLTEAVKEYKHTVDLDAQLREQFTEMDTFSKKIPPLSVVEKDFQKVDGAVKNEAKLLQSLKSQVSTVKTLMGLLIEEAREAKKNLVIDEQDLKAANDLEKAAALKEQLEAGPLANLGGFISKGSEAIGAWAKVEEDPIAFVTKALDTTEALMKLLGLDTVNQKIASLQKEAGELKLKAAAGRLKLAGEKLSSMKTLEGQLAPALKDVREQYADTKAALPQDFDDANKNGHFYFKSMTELSTKLAAYRATAQTAATTAHDAADTIFKTTGKLGNQWTPNIKQATDILQKMTTVTKNAMTRAIHERDGADARIKVVSAQVDALEKMLSKTRLKSG